MDSYYAALAKTSLHHDMQCGSVSFRVWYVTATVAWISLWFGVEPSTILGDNANSTWQTLTVYASIDVDDIRKLIVGNYSPEYVDC